jgi:hypothetical protein
MHSAPMPQVSPSYTSRYLVKLQNVTLGADSLQLPSDYTTRFTTFGMLLTLSAIGATIAAIAATLGEIDANRLAQPT